MATRLFCTVQVKKNIYIYGNYFIFSQSVPLSQLHTFNTTIRKHPNNKSSKLIFKPSHFHINNLYSNPTRLLRSLSLGWASYNYSSLKRSKLKLEIDFGGRWTHSLQTNYTARSKVTLLLPFFFFFLACNSLCLTSINSAFFSNTFWNSNSIKQLKKLIHDVFFLLHLFHWCVLCVNCSTKRIKANWYEVVWLKYDVGPLIGVIKA